MAPEFSVFQPYLSIHLSMYVCLSVYLLISVVLQLPVNYLANEIKVPVTPSYLSLKSILHQVNS